MLKRSAFISVSLLLLLFLVVASVIAADTAGASADMPGDVDGDGWVYVDDLLLVVNGMQAGPQADLRADVNGDGVVDVRDVAIIGLNFSGTPPSFTCDDLATVNAATQVEIVEADLDCVPIFVELLKADPWTHLEAFYALIPSTIASDAVWDLLYDELRFGLFVFDADVVDDLRANLPDAVAACEGSFRCEDWAVWILPGAFDGGMYRCPDLASLDAAGLLASIPYGGYYCTEDTAVALGPLADDDTITGILALVESHENGWSRRNGVRVLGRLAERSAEDPAHVLVTETRAADVQATLMGRFEADRYPNVLHDVIWVLDSFFYPFFDMQPHLEAVSADAEFYSDLRFRAMAAYARLVWSMEDLLSENDLDFILGSLASDDVWIRAEAAYICESLREEHLDEAGRDRVIGALNQAWEVEQELTAKVFLARAIDSYTGSNLSEALRDEYEGVHLANTAVGDGITVRSGLPAEELPAFVTLMERERAAFFDLMGEPFDTPLPGDQNDSMVLILFATPERYQEYMSSFVGFAAFAGGLYLEGIGTLYTYQRTPQQSTYTVEELIQHEFGHYLQGRYVYPGQWGEVGYHDQPKGWVDEGTGEFLAGLVFDDVGGYAYEPRPAHLNVICGQANYRSLAGLIGQREGYDQFGVFDYTNGWALIYYLMTERKEQALNLYLSLRDGTYRLEDFAAIAGVASVEDLEAEWHGAMDVWCQEYLDPAQEQDEHGVQGPDGYRVGSLKPLSPANEPVLTAAP